MCCLNYTILGIDLENDNMPIILRAHGVSALPVRQLITQLRMNRSLKGEYHRAVVSIKTQEKDTPYGSTFIMRPKLTRLITDEVEAEELKVESLRLLGTPIQLIGEGTGEERGEEPEPLGFTAEGTPFYSEEERGALMAEKSVSKPVVDEKKKDKEEPPSSEGGDSPKESKGKEIDVDF